MKAEVIMRPGFAAVRVQLGAGETVRAQPGAMMAQRNVRMVRERQPGASWAASEECWRRSPFS